MEAALTVDATFAALAEEVEVAAKDLMDLASNDPDRWWPAYELQARARNGTSAGAVSLALSRLVKDGKLEAGDGDLVRLKS